MQFYVKNDRHFSSVTLQLNSEICQERRREKVCLEVWFKVLLPCCGLSSGCLFTAGIHSAQSATTGFHTVTVQVMKPAPLSHTLVCGWVGYVTHTWSVYGCLQDLDSPVCQRDWHVISVPGNPIHYHSYLLTAAEARFLHTRPSVVSAADSAWSWCRCSRNCFCLEYFTHDR